MADVQMIVKFVYPDTTNICPFVVGKTFTLEGTSHCITVGGTHYAPVNSEVVNGDVIRHYLLPDQAGTERRHGIGIVGSGDTLKLVGAMTVDPPDRRPVQAAGMWVAEPQG